MTVKDAYTEISRISTLVLFNRFLGKHNCPFDLNIIPDTIPRSPEHALFVRQLALYVDKGWRRNCKLRSKWQNYWLSCCKSGKCDYIFSVLKECGIDRETDVRYIVDESLKKGGLLAKHIGSDEGVKFYKKTIADWYLKRYNGKEAKRILGSGFFDRWDRFKLCYPRLIVAIVIGLLALMTGQEMWNLPHELFPAEIGLMGLLSVFFLSMGFVLFTVSYLTYECYNIIFDKKEAFKRALRVGVKGYCVSLFISVMLCVMLGRISVDKKYATFYYSISDSMSGDFSKGWPILVWPTLNGMLPVLKNSLFFASAALFIGIFIQVFWEKETITEPL